MQSGCTLHASGVQMIHRRAQSRQTGQTQPNLAEMSEIPTTWQTREPEGSAHHCPQSSGALLWAQSLGCVRLFAAPWTIACQAPLSMEALQARMLEWVAVPSSSGSSQPGSPALQTDFVSSEPPGKHLGALLHSIIVAIADRYTPIVFSNSGCKDE